MHNSRDVLSIKSSLSIMPNRQSAIVSIKTTMPLHAKGYCHVCFDTKRYNACFLCVCGCLSDPKIWKERKKRRRKMSLLPIHDKLAENTLKYITQISNFSSCDLTYKLWPIEIETHIEWYVTWGVCVTGIYIGIWHTWNAKKPNMHENRNAKKSAILCVCVQ